MTLALQGRLVSSSLMTSLIFAIVFVAFFQVVGGLLVPVNAPIWWQASASLASGIIAIASTMTALILGFRALISADMMDDYFAITASAGKWLAIALTVTGACWYVGVPITLNVINLSFAYPAVAIVIVISVLFLAASIRR